MRRRGKEGRRKIRSNFFVAENDGQDPENMVLVIVNIIPTWLQNLKIQEGLSDHDSSDPYNDGYSSYYISLFQGIDAGFNCGWLVGYGIRWDGNMMISKLKKCFSYVKRKVWNTESSDNDSVPMEDTHETSSPDIEDPYLAELASTIAQFQDSRIITKEEYQHLLKLKEKGKNNGHK